MKTSHVILSPNISSSETLVAEKHHRKIVPSLHRIQKQKSVHAINHVNCRSLQKLEHESSGESTIPLNRHPTHQICVSGSALRVFPN